jgi:predicted RNA methylase
VSGARLEELLRQPGYTPRARDVGTLFDRLSLADDDEAKLIERALGRIGSGAANEARVRFDAAHAPLRARLCSVAGRVAQVTREPGLVEWLAARLADPDPKARRRAATALGKLGDPSVEAALIAALEDARDLPDLRALAKALGSAGGERGLARLAALPAHDPELARIVREATLKLERGFSRREPSSIDLGAAPREATTVLLHVRAGLENFLLEELGKANSARLSGRGRVAVVLDGPLESLYRARTFLHFGFPLEPESVRAGDVAAAVAAVLTSARAVDVLTRFTRGKIRYRLAWASGGRRRALNFRVATLVSSLRPELLNDPTAAPWELVITEKSDKFGSRIYGELWPQAVDDPRFTYRRHTMVASSHPTIAAALARAGGVGADDVVWDPFAGSATELIERARLGPYARLFGSDSDPAALGRARENLAAAGVARCELAVGQAQYFRVPAPPSLVITNPPFGRRVRAETGILELLERALANVAAQLRQGGRLVWISPEPNATARAAERHGFSVKLRQAVDVGGIAAELQSFVAPKLKSGEWKSSHSA